MLGNGHPGRVTMAKYLLVFQLDTAPVHSPPYRAASKMREFKQSESDVILANNIIDSAHTEGAASIVFFLKKDGTVRFCIDYRELNTVAKRDTYPIPPKDKYADVVGEAIVFSTLDAIC